jgi:putative hemolysin
MLILVSWQGECRYLYRRDDVQGCRSRPTTARGVFGRFLVVQYSCRGARGAKCRGLVSGSTAADLLSWVHLAGYGRAVA